MGCLNDRLWQMYTRWTLVHNQLLRLSYQQWINISTIEMKEEGEEEIEKEGEVGLV